MRAKIRRCAVGVLISVPLFFAQGTQPQAALVQIDGSGLATGITDLSVGTETFDIDFILGTYNDVFPGTDEFSNGMDIVNGIATVLNIAGSPFIQPLNGTALVGFFSVPISLTSDGFFLFRMGTGECDNSDLTAFPLCPAPYTTSLGGLVPTSAPVVWAVPSPVPLPAALPLFGSALAMLGIVGWRRRRQAAG